MSENLESLVIVESMDHDSELGILKKEEIILFILMPDKILVEYFIVS
jgi:hypothetical protein